MATANRLHRCAIALMVCIFRIEYRRTEDFGRADGLSRLPLKSADLFDQQDLSINEVVNLVTRESLSELPISVYSAANESVKDSELKQIIEFILNGWPAKLPENWISCGRRKYELSIFDGCILLGDRVVVPSSLGNEVLQFLNATHAGVVEMKVQVRCHCWWPRIDKMLEDTAAKCSVCTLLSRDPQKVPLQQWPVPPGPWYRVHVDFAGPFMNTMLFILVDAYSKWPEVVVMKKRILLKQSRF